MEYTLSVIIPNYNNSHFLTQCIESVLEQSYDKVIEVIVVDDCSTDNSRDLILLLGKKYSKIRPVLLQKNGGVSAARNAGLEAAVGEYVTFIDADDCYHNKEKLKNEMKLIQRWRKQGKDIVSYSSIVSMSYDGKDYVFPEIKQSKYLQGNIFKKLIVDFRSGLVMRDYCVKAEIVRGIGGYNKENTLFEDYELLLKLAKRVDFYYTGEVGTAYRNSINGLSKKPHCVLKEKKKEIAHKQIKEESLLCRIELKIKRSIVYCVREGYHKAKKWTKRG